MLGLRGKRYSLVLTYVQRAPVPAQEMSPGVIGQFIAQPKEFEAVLLPSPYPRDDKKLIPHIRVKA
jgi:hypothetical protein